MDGDDSKRFSGSLSIFFTYSRWRYAAAIALGQASALTVMVADLTLGKEKWQDGWEIFERAMLLAVKIMSRSGSLADEDSDAFDEVMSSFRLPRDTEQDKARGKKQ